MTVPSEAAEGAKTWPAQWKDAALVLLGHGSARHPEGAKATLDHAERLRALGLFADVRVGFWKQDPFLSRCLDGLSTKTAYVVPNLACKGYVTQEVIPRELKLEEIADKPGTPRLILCDPVGAHPMMAQIVAKRIGAVTKEWRLDPSETCLLLIGHGSSRNRISAIQTESVARTLADAGIAGEVRTAFLEHPPLINEWAEDARVANVIAMPYMISNGLHGARDVPRLLGLDPDDAQLARLAQSGEPAGPFSRGEKRLWYCRAVGAEADVAQVILACVVAATRS